MNIIQKIKSLNLPKDQYVVTGAGILGALGIRETNDLDIAVTEKLFKQLQESGLYKSEEKYGKTFLMQEDVDVIPSLNWEEYDTTTEEAIRTATFIDDIPFMNLDELCKFKKALGREKDFKDIELIRAYQQKSIS